jgi:hypothetical protein
VPLTTLAASAMGSGHGGARKGNFDFGLEKNESAFHLVALCLSLVVTLAMMMTTIIGQKDGRRQDCRRR